MCGTLNVEGIDDMHDGSLIFPAYFPRLLVTMLCATVYSMAVGPGVLKCGGNHVVQQVGTRETVRNKYNAVSLVARSGYGTADCKQQTKKREEEGAEKELETKQKETKKRIRPGHWSIPTDSAPCHYVTSIHFTARNPAWGLSLT